MKSLHFLLLIIDRSARQGNQLVETTLQTLDMPLADVFKTVRIGSAIKGVRTYCTCVMLARDSMTLKLNCDFGKDFRIKEGFESVHKNGEKKVQLKLLPL